MAGDTVHARSSCSQQVTVAAAPLSHALMKPGPAARTRSLELLVSLVLHLPGRGPAPGGRPPRIGEVLMVPGREPAATGLLLLPGTEQVPFPGTAGAQARAGPLSGTSLVLLETNVGCSPSWELLEEEDSEEMGFRR